MEDVSMAVNVLDVVFSVSVFAGGGRWGYGNYGRGRENYSGGMKNTHKRFDSSDYSGECSI
jgi:hypothetical protein